MTRKARRFLRGASLLELASITALVLILLAVAFVRYAALQADAERTAQSAVRDALRFALTLKATELALSKGASHVRTLEKSNPFDLLSERLSNYGGEVSLPANLAPATWYYSPGNNQLLYVERWTNERFPVPESGAVKMYRVIVEHGAGGVDGVTVQPVDTTKR